MNPLLRRSIAAILLLSLSSLPTLQATSDDWPGYRGSANQGQSPESILVSWPAAGPRQFWKIDTPTGFSSFAVAQGRAFTLVRRTLEGVEHEVCLALDAASAQELWATPIGIAKYDGGGHSGAPDNNGGDGPRSTPATDGNHVFTFNARLELACLESSTGQILWTRDLLKQHRGRNIAWQNAASPVLDGDRIFIAGGGSGESFLAIDKTDGRVLWNAGDEKITHATPTVTTLHGVRQVVFFAQRGLVSLSTTTGELLWSHPFKFKTSTAASPVIAGPVVFCSAGYGVGATAIKISLVDGQFVTTELWRSRGDRDVANHWSTPVHFRGHLYGMFSFKKYGEGPLKCVEIGTGRVVWEQPGFGAGNVILAGDHLLVLSDRGELLLVNASAENYQEIARSKVLDGKCWSTPALADGRLYVRSTTEGVCLDLQPTAPAP